MSYMYYLSFTNYLLPKCITFEMQKHSMLIIHFMTREENLVFHPTS